MYRGKRILYYILYFIIYFYHTTTNMLKTFIIAYCILIWFMLFKYGDQHEINKILVLQKRALRIITHNVFPSVPGPLYPTGPLFYKLEVLKIQDVFKLQVSKFIFNCLQ